MISRRIFTLGSVGVALLPGQGWAATRIEPGWDAEMADIERRVRGRLGVGVHDTATGLRLGWREDERFPMASTFKLLLAAWALQRADRGLDSLQARVRFDAAMLQPHSPVTGPHAGGPGMTVAQLCEAVVTISDNTAANLLLARYGGPAGFTAFVRSLGDAVTRLDRNEPMLNEGRAGDPRDTTSPRAMLRSMHAVTVGEALSPASRAQLIDWLVASRTGDRRLRAGVPGWRVGDKTGTGGNGSSNDIGLLWPPGRPAPVLVSCYITQSTEPDAQRDAAIAAVAQAVARRIAG